ncbi:triphosphoribosyl-dephospho-CoA synthase CitG [Vagococcus sp. PNs007]|uniref:Probable 2-(5''-triphosphoribosyl)-3'-dephosphocoenzyme-A synthase n=1 Tax=Vagococcus proximus TaxID=2991417 RepID=A0ABT5WZ79_9ENTE|nr:triphosphoribosyl-dephospho-CoA synthase CitG [Vagococcus proximus]MDF0479060.1 triphosphoribosyl-dephospho-CoA synthase CitG [Vagococcus proximus]
MKNARYYSQFAQRAMLYEAVCHPKPGLVDPVNSGAHQDMDIFTFIDSSCSMQKEFEDMYLAGYQFEGNDLNELFDSIRPIGLKAEKEMMQSTHNVNTHKGAIFSLGIILAGLGHLESQKKTVTIDSLQSVVKAMTGHLLDDFKGLELKTEEALTNGEKLYIDYGLLGVRGEVAQGFPTVLNYGLPLLEQYGACSNESLLNVLMLMLYYNEDSNLIKRAGDIKILNWSKTIVTRYFEKGGSQTEEGITYLNELNDLFISENLSIGGTADLLIVTVFIFLVTSNQKK